MSTSQPTDPHDRNGTSEELAKPRFWGPASYWRLGLVALLLIVVLLAVFGT